MLSQSQIEAIAQAVLQELKQNPSSKQETSGISVVSDKIDDPSEKEGMMDLTSAEAKATPLLDHVEDREGLERMMGRTTARIGVGNCGP